MWKKVWSDCYVRTKCVSNRYAVRCPGCSLLGHRAEGGESFSFLGGEVVWCTKSLLSRAYKSFFLTMQPVCWQRAEPHEELQHRGLFLPVCVCVFSRLSPQHKVGQVLSLLINAHCQRSHVRTGVSQSVLSLCGTVLRLLLKSNLNADWFSVSGCTAELPVEWLPAPLGF